MLTIERATPEETGIPLECIIQMMERLERRQIPMHSLLIMHRDRLICESYYAPCRADTLHRMFSITKSFTAVAIGLLADEGRLSLDDRIIDYFPEKVPADVHPYIAEMTIRDMLMMRTCHEKTTYKLDMKRDWVESFFTTPPTHPAGTLFHYDTSSAHTLCALAEKLSGMDMLDYIKEKLAPVGFSEASYLLKDPFGVSIGGSGLVATSMDILRFGLFLYREGNIDGKQLLSASYIREATSLLTATAVTAPLPSEACGYGMQIWRTQHNGYVCYGMGGQLIIVLPDYDLICVTTADTQDINGGNQQIYDALYEEVLPCIDRAKHPGAALPDAASAPGCGGKDVLPYASARSAQVSAAQPEETTARYRQFLASRTLHVPAGAKDCPLAAQISGKRYRIQEGDFSYLRIDIPTLPGNTAGEEAETDGRITFGYRGREYALDFGLGYPRAAVLPLYDLHCAASGVWLADGTLYVRADVIDSCVGSVHFQFSFQGSRLTLFMRKREESLLEEFTGHLTGTVI